MKWKNWPYWVRGGVVVLLIYWLFTLALIPFGPECGGAFLCIPLWGFPSIPGLFIAGQIDFIQDLIDTFIESEWFPNAWIIITVSSLVYFVFGAFIGWLYGKIKNLKFANLI